MTSVVTVILMMFLDSTSSLSSLERMVLEMGQLQATIPNSVDMKSFTRLAQKPSDRQLLQAAKSYVGDGGLVVSISTLKVDRFQHMVLIKKNFGFFTHLCTYAFRKLVVNGFRNMIIAAIYQI